MKRKLSHSPSPPSFPSQKLCLQGIERFTDEVNILKFFQKTFPPTIKLSGISKKKGNTYAFLAFETSEDKDEFSKFVDENNVKFKNKKITIKPVLKEGADRVEKKVHKILEEIEERSQKKYTPSQKEIDYELSVPLQARVCSFLGTPYEEQIEKKKNILNEILKLINTKGQNLLKNDSEAIPDWLKKEKPCEIEDFIIADEEERLNYRNKAEFTIGKNFEKEINVGFNRGNFNKGISWIEKPDQCPIVSQESLKIAELLRKFIVDNLEKNSSLDAYNKFDHSGFWRNLVIRQSKKTKEILITVVVRELDVEKESLPGLKAELKELFISNTPSEYTIKGILYQVHNDVNDNIPFDLANEVLFGEEFYHEIILNKKFRVSPSSFLQINISQCEKLYTLIGNLAKIDKDTIFLDICSGIGTIGICLADKAEKILAVEMVKSACMDSEYNAQINNITNCECFNSKVEDVIDKIIQPYIGIKKIIGVVDPPRAGLHNSVVKKLRTCKGLDNLVYVSCNPNAMVENLMGLCLPTNKNRKGPPFKPVKCFGVDLFPQTEHYECVVMLERVYEL